MALIASLVLPAIPGAASGSPDAAPPAGGSPAAEAHEAPPDPLLRPRTDAILTGDLLRAAPIVVTQIPLDAAPAARRSKPETARDEDGTLDANALSAGMLPDAWGAGARIVMVRPGSRKRLLTEGFHSAADPEISFDGKRMLFAGKRAAGDPWRIYEMVLATGQVRSITGRPRGEGAAGSTPPPGVAGAAPIDHRSPLYEGPIYVITAKEPWEQITFVGTVPDQVNEHGPVPVTALYSCRMDGSELQRLTYNPSSALTPAVLPDGRLVFSSWQRAGLDRGFPGRVALFASNTDGLDSAVFSGDEGRRVKLMPSATPDLHVVFVEGDAVPWDGAGALASVSLTRSLHSYRAITTPGQALYHSPSALPDGTILVSRRPADGSGTHGVFRLDPRKGRAEPVFDDRNHHDVQAKLVAPRPEPDGRSSVLTPDNPNGTLYGLDVFTSDLEGNGWLEPGQPWRLRVLEGIPRRAGGVVYAAVAPWLGFHVPGATTEGIPPLLQRRFLGEIEVEDDGSFNVLVPANTPVQLQLVDPDGMSVRSCDWIWVRNREARGCIGCHEDGERAPENRFPKAIVSRPINLSLPPERRRTVDFRKHVQPILTRRCAIPACHHVNGEANPTLDGDPGRIAGAGGASLFSRAYESLLAPAPSGSTTPDASGRFLTPDERESGWRIARGLYVHPGRARTSPLVWHLFGRNTSLPWDQSDGDARGSGAAAPGERVEAGRAWAQMPPDGSPPLTEDERRTIVEWIDLGALWNGIPPEVK